MSEAEQQWQPRWWHQEAPRLMICTPLALIGAFLVPGEYQLRTLAGWDLYAVGFLWLTWWALRGRSAGELRLIALRSRRKRRRDERLGLTSQYLVQGAITIAMTAAFQVLPRADDLDAPEFLVIALSVVAVGTSWILLQTGYLSIYVDEYAHGGGLDFPGGEEPDIVDFTYFAFSVGTSFGTNDVTVTRRALRRQVLNHSVIAFVLNTAVLTIAVTFVTTYLSAG